MNGKHVTGVAKISMLEAHVHILAGLLAIFVSQSFGWLNLRFSWWNSYLSAVPGLLMLKQSLNHHFTQWNPASLGPFGQARSLAHSAQSGTAVTAEAPVTTPVIHKCRGGGNHHGMTMKCLWNTMNFQNWIGQWTNSWWFMYYSLGDG